MTAEDTPTPKKGKGRVSLHPLKFEDALRGLLKAKPLEKGDESNGVTDQDEREDVSPPPDRRQAARG